MLVFIPYYLCFNALLDNLVVLSSHLFFQTLNKIFRAGYSRIPVYDGDKNIIIGLILTKELLFVDLTDEVPIRTFMSLFPRSILGVQECDTLSEVAIL